MLERHHAGFDPAGQIELIARSRGICLPPRRRSSEWCDRAGALRLSARHHAAHPRLAFADPWSESTRCHQPDAGAQAYAAFDDRDYLIPDDVKQATLPVLRHRVMLRPEAELEGLDADRVLTDVMAAVPVPRQTDSAQPRPERVR